MKIHVSVAPWLWGVLLLALVASACSAAPIAVPLENSLAEKIVYQDIPPGFDFPANEATLLRFRDTQNVAEQRRHAWYVWAGMTQPAAGGEAIWETWYSEEETFSLVEIPEAVEEREIQRNLTVPKQFFNPDDLSPSAAGESLLSFVLFNGAAHKHIRDNDLYLRATLTALNQQLTDDDIPIANRDLPPFPRDAVAIKTLWWIVAGDQLTAMPVWDFEPTRPDNQGNPIGTWRRVIAVDAARTQIPVDEVTSVTFRAALHEDARVIPLNQFYYFRLETQEQVDAANDAAAGGVLDLNVPRMARIGDYAVLAALHYTTKEITDWVWATFWWHDLPNQGPYSLDRPEAVEGVWRNYLMDTAYSMETPREFNGSANSVYNPWLEARFPANVQPNVGGLSTNCMTCHQLSVWRGSPVGFPVTSGGLAPDDPYFADAMQLDFLWSFNIASK